MKKVAFHNLGCKVNGYELDVMRQKMLAAGYEIVPFEEEADIYVINTCTVTNIADRKSRQMMHRAKKRNPNSVVIAVGCYVETDPERVGTDRAIDLAIGNNNKGKIAEIIDEFLRLRTNSEGGFADRTLQGTTKTALWENPDYEDMQLEAPDHTRAYVKIQDGCNQFCSYCIIPYARGRVRSRRPGEIVREVEGLAKRGIHEIVLTGIHISSYGLEWYTDGNAQFDPVKSGEQLLDLMEKLRIIPGIERIRLGSLEPRIITEAFVEKLASMKEVCPHFHLSLQSGCDETLRRMNRHYTTEEFMQGVQLLRKYYDRPALTTDVIVGFPGETIAEFEKSANYLEKVNFYEMHVFKYSVRRGTVAEKLKGQIPEAAKAVRSDRLLAMTATQARAYRSSFVGETAKVLLEETVTVDGDTYWTGHTERYVQVFVPQADGLFSGATVEGTIAEEMEGTGHLTLKTLKQAGK